MVLGSVLAASLMLAAFVALVLQIDADRDATRAALRSQEAISAAATLEKSVIDLQTGARGFILTGQPRFLEPWEEAGRRLPDQMHRLRALVADDPDRRAVVDALTVRIERFADDVSVRQVELARRDPARAAGIVRSGAGERVIDDIRRGFDRFRADEIALAARRGAADRAVESRSIGLVAALTLGMLLLVGATVVVLGRHVIRPIRRLAAASAAVAAGDLSTRVPSGGAGEVAELGASFNAMTAALATAREELEERNAQLADNATALTRQNVELERRQAEITRVLAELAAEKAQIEAFYRFGRAITVAETFADRARIVLDTVADHAGADLGTLYVADKEEDAAMRLAAVVGTPDADLPQVVMPGQGDPGRATERGTSIVRDREDGATTVAAVGAPRRIAHELHVPLLVGSRSIGVLSLGRASGHRFTDEDRGAVEHLGRYAAGALMGALALEWARNQAGVARTILDATPEGLALIDSSGAVAVANLSMMRIFSLLGLADREPVWPGLVAVADRTTAPDDLRDAGIRLMEDPGEEVMVEFELQGSKRVFQLFSAAAPSTADAPPGRALVIREVTGEREADRLKQDLVGLVSHELRTPLTSITGYAQLLLADSDALPEAQRGYAGIILRNGERLMRLFGDLLLLAQVDAGRLPIDIAPVDLTAVVEERVESARAFADERGVHLYLDLEPMPVFLGDGTRLGQLVDNLVSNGLKFTEPGGDVSVCVRMTAGKAVLTVRDTGVGIPSNEIPRIFDRFYRADTARDIPGTGLGLSIAEAVARAHGGLIRVESTQGRGTQVTVELAITPVPVALR